MTLRPYKPEDSKIICSWVKDEKLHASRITLGVFANNPKARACYESVGFKKYSSRTVNILGSDWECVDMELLV